MVEGGVGGYMKTWYELVELERQGFFTRFALRDAAQMRRSSG